MMMRFNSNKILPIVVMLVTSLFTLGTSANRTNNYFGEDINGIFDKWFEEHWYQALNDHSPPSFVATRMYQLMDASKLMGLFEKVSCPDIKGKLSRALKEFSQIQEFAVLTKKPNFYDNQVNVWDTSDTKTRMEHNLRIKKRLESFLNWL
jgi:hypothetical protein